MSILPEALESLLNDLKASRIVCYTDSAWDTYGGSSRWEMEIRYDATLQKYYHQTDYWASGYEKTPERIVEEWDENQVLACISNQLSMKRSIYSILR
jgi:hypothetical protein